MGLISIAMQLAEFTSWADPDSVRAEQLNDKQWKHKRDEAKKLENQHDRGSFERLIALMIDPHPYVSYTASESFQTRADIQFTEILIKAIDSVAVENLWRSYQALSVYATPQALKYMIDQLQKQLDVEADKWEDRPSFYLAKSIVQICHKMNAGCKMNAPSKFELKDYKIFLNTALQHHANVTKQK